MTARKSPVVVGVGEVLWDMFPEGKQFGGAPANFAYHARMLGADAHVVSCVGADNLGNEILRRLESLGLSRKYVAVDPDHPTGTVSVKVDNHGKPQYVIHEGVAWDYIPTMPGLVELAKRSNAVCFGSLAQRSPDSRTTIRDLLAQTPDECLRIFDINFRQHYYDAETVAVGLEAANVLKLNDEELPEVARLLDLAGKGNDVNEDDVLASLLDQCGLKLIALTRGSHGSTLIGPQQRSDHPATPTEIVDTVGAGDSFTAAVTMGLLHDLPLETINERANQVAAFVCSQAGATPEMPEQLTRWAH